MTTIAAAKMKALLLIAAHLSGWPVPNEPPPIGYEVTSFEMSVISQDDEGETIGLTRDMVDVVFINVEAARVASNHPELGTPDEDSILVHELTHWLQAKNGMKGYKCPVILKREIQAYAVQTRYAKEYEHKDNADYRPPPELYALCKSAALNMSRP